MSFKEIIDAEMTEYNDGAYSDHGSARSQLEHFANAIAETFSMDANSNLHNPKLTTILFAILVKRLGGRTEITQADVDDIAYNRLEEEKKDDGSLEFRLIERPRAT